MFVYKLKCKPTGRTYVGVSNGYPEIGTVDVPINVWRDLNNFGPSQFALSVVCELNNRENAEYKTKIISEKCENSY